MWSAIIFIWGMALSSYYYSHSYLPRYIEAKQTIFDSINENMSYTTANNIINLVCGHKFTDTWYLPEKTHCITNTQYIYDNAKFSDNDFGRIVNQT